MLHTARSAAIVAFHDACLARTDWPTDEAAARALLPTGPLADAWGWVLVVAFCGTYSHYCFARAMQHAPATVLVPMDFLRVPLSAAAGWAVYQERVDVFTVAGVVLILGANLLNLRKAAD